MRKLVLFLLLLTWSASAQVPFPSPQVPLTGRIGPQGNFPLFNSGFITISGNYTMTYPDMSASVIRFIGTLSAQATITAPAATTLGFEFTVINATTGNQSIIFKGATGTGVTIPNGQAMIVVSDGTNYMGLSSLTTGGPPTGAAGGNLSGTYPNPNVVGIRGYNVPAPSPGYLNWTGSAFAWNTPAGGGGSNPFKYSVPADYPTVQAAVNAAAAANSGPVIVTQDATDTGTFTNPTNVRVIDFRRQEFGLDSLWSYDAKQYGVKADGTVRSCNATAGSTLVQCGDSIAGVAHFTAADIGKDVIVFAAGPPDGRVMERDPDGTWDPITVISGGTGGTDGLHPITFTDTTDGCSTDSNGQPDINTMPYAWVQVSAGKPTGRAYLSQAWAGDKCIHPPRKGTVESVTGEVTFTGGSIEQGDWPSVIADVPNPTAIVLADATPNTGNGTVILYGTDDHDAFERACNATVRGWSAFSSGHLTFSGTVMTSRAILCGGPGLHIEGTGYAGIGKGAGSNIVYAGRNTGDSILRLENGWGAKVERMGFRGNTIARPNGITAAYIYPVGAGPGVSQMFVFDELWFGNNGNDLIPAVRGPRLHNCIFAENYGNTDFADIDHTYCLGAQVAFDSNNNQSTNWRFGKIHSQNDGVGFVIFGHQQMDDYYTEYNRVDIMAGSPEFPVAYPMELLVRQYGGESSAMSIELSPLKNEYGWQHYKAVPGGINIESAIGLGWEPHACGQRVCHLRPDRVWIDLGGMVNGSLSWHSKGLIHLPEAKVVLRDEPSNPRANFDISGIRAEQIFWATAYDPGSYSYNNLLSGWLHLDNADEAHQDKLDIMFQQHSDIRHGEIASTLQNDNFFQNTTGSIKVRSPRPPGQSDWAGQNFFFQVDATGSGATQYCYQVTCDDGQLLETNPSQMVCVNNGPLNGSTNYNAIGFWPHRGCTRYSFYGNNGTGGAGGIGYLTTKSQGELVGNGNLYFPNLSMWDTGQYSKDTNRKPPLASQSGSVDAELGFKVNGAQLASTHLADFATTAPSDGQVPIFNATLGKYVPGHVSGSDGGAGPSGGIQTINGNGNTNQSIVQGAGINVVSANGTTTISNTAMGGGDGGGGGPTSISSLSDATQSHYVNAYNFLQSWRWNFAGTSGVTQGFHVGETAAGANYNARLFQIDTGYGSNTQPFQVTAGGNNGMRIDHVGDITAIGTAHFVGPVQLPMSLANKSVLGTDENGNIIQSVAGGGDGGAGPSGGIQTINGNGNANQTIVHGAGIDVTSSNGVTTITNTAQGGGDGAGGGPTSVSSLTDATQTNYVNAFNTTQAWRWHFTDNNPIAGFIISETNASTNYNAKLFQLNTLYGSATQPFEVTAGNNGFRVNHVGELVALGTARYIGPVRLPSSLANKSVLGTDQDGNIIQGSGGVGGFTAGGDLSGSDSSQTVVGIRGHSVPAPTGPAWLYFDGSNMTWDENTARRTLRASAVNHPAGSIACFKDDGSLGSCQTAMTGTPPHCTCQ